MNDSTAQFKLEEDPFFAEDLRQMAEAKNYLRWQFGMIAPHIHGKVLEIGGGIGNFTPAIARAAEAVTSLEPNRDCFRQLAQNTQSLRNVTVLNATAEALDAQLPADYLADTVVCMNVLEHIQNDEAAVRDFARRLRVGGSMVLLVPGVAAVFGRIDQRLGHYRRYSRTGLTGLLQRTGFEVAKLRYFNLIGLLGWWWNTKFAKIEKQSDTQIRIFDRYIVPLMSRLEALLAPPVGQSLLAVGTKMRSG